MVLSSTSKRYKAVGRVMMGVSMASFVDLGYPNSDRSDHQRSLRSLKN